MNINYYAKNFELGEEVKGYIEERLVKFEKYSNDKDSLLANMKIEKTKHQNDSDAFDMTIELEIDGNGYFAEKTAPTTFQSFDECESALNSIITKAKDKEVSERRRSGGIKEAELEQEY